MNNCHLTSQPKTVLVAHSTGKDLMPLLLGENRVQDSERKKLAQFKDLLDRMLALDPEKRATPSEALHHAFITEKFDA